MLIVTIVAAGAALVSAGVAALALRHAKRSAISAQQSVAEAKRSADAAERSAGAATITAEADRAQDHRERQPRLLVAIDQHAAHDGPSAIYRITNMGPTNLDSVVVHRPILGEVENRIIHPVARAGGGDFGEEAEVGPVVLGTYGRFTLSLGSGTTLPSFMVTVVSRVGQEGWTEVFQLENPRRPPPPRIRSLRAAGS